MTRFLYLKLCMLLFAGSLYAQTNYEVSIYSGKGNLSTERAASFSSISKDSADYQSLTGITVDDSGHVYLIEYDYVNGLYFAAWVRKINANGQVEIISRGPEKGVGHMGIAVDKEGNIYTAGVGTRNAQGIQKISPNQQSSTLVALGYYNPADGAIGNARSVNASNVCLDPSGTIYFLDNGYLRKIKNGQVTTFHNTHEASDISIAIDKQGFIYRLVNRGPYSAQSNIIKYDSVGNSTEIKTAISGGRHICVDKENNLFVAALGRVLKVDQNGNHTIIAGSGGLNVQGPETGLGTTVKFNNIVGICADTNSNLYVIDNAAGQAIVKKLTPLPPAPPKVSYIDIPSDVCLGSTLNESPSITGSEVSLAVNQNTINSADSIKGVYPGPNGTFIVLYLGDSIVEYTSLGVRTRRYDEMGLLSNIRKLAIESRHYPKWQFLRTEVVSQNPYIVDSIFKDTSSIRIYAWSDGVNTNAIHRIDSTGWAEFAGFQTTNYSFNEVTDMAFGPDGYLYVADDMNGYIAKVDPSNSVVSQFSPQQEVSSIAFDQNQMLIFKQSEQKVYASNLGSASFTEVFHGIDSLNMDFSDFEFERSGRVGQASILVSSKSQNKLLRFVDFGGGFDFKLSNTGNIQYSELASINAPLAVCHVTANDNREAIWAATANNTLVNTYAAAYTITPALPKGLSYDIISGKVKGTPTQVSPGRTYYVDITSDIYGNQRDSFTFAVTPSSNVSDNTGTASSENMQEDGLDITYYDVNNCQKLIDIADEIGGTVIGDVKVKQEVFPTIASFASDSNFVRRVTEIEASDPNAQARIKLFFTYQDIALYNLSNGTNTDLSNDTTTDTMQVAVLQLHKKELGEADEQIKHNPITAKWDPIEQVWAVEFQVTKFSTFYMGETTALASFDCTSNGSSETITSCGAYYWQNELYNQSGIYYDTIPNQHGCDSILTLDLTVTLGVEIEQDEFFPEYLYCTTSDAEHYQWISCDIGGISLENDTNSTIELVYNGNYAVIVTKDGCTDTSNCITVGGLQDPPSGGGSNGISAEALNSLIHIFPNPSTGVFEVNGASNTQIRVYNVVGKMVFENLNPHDNTSLDLSLLPNGVYYVQFSTSDSSITRSIIKN
ncbi:MAG: T9SS type A sorting domain-containing protein [Bacteroidetes bacterium]|nr:MAG: T9SS type A sorting domain-containing protein [Bacteroidota bacterium]